MALRDCSVSHLELLSVHDNSVHQIPTAPKWTDGQVLKCHFLQATDYRLHNSMVGLMSCELENLILME